MNRTHSLDWGELDGMGRRGLRGGALLAAGSWLRFALQLGSSIVLARILGPSEYGLAAILIVFGAASELLRDSGAATLVTQARELTHENATSLFWRSVKFGVVAAIIIALLGVPMDAAFHEPRFLLFAPLMATMFIATGVAAIPGAVNTRNLRFGAGALSDGAGAALGAAVGLVSALAGAGALALVLQSVVFVAAQSLIVWFLCPWRPGTPRSGDSLHTQRVESRGLTVMQIVNYGVSNIDNVLVGLAGGLRDAGLYNQAFRVMVLPLQQVLGPIRRAILPIMGLLRDDPARFRALYTRLVLCSTFVLWSMFSIAFIEAPSLIDLVFGAAWAGAVPIFRILAVAGLAEVLGYVTNWVYIASRQSRSILIWSLVTAPIFISAFLIGLPWGASGVAISYSAVCVLMVVPEYLLATKPLPLVLADLFRPLGWPTLSVLLVLGAGTAAGAWQADRSFGPLVLRLVIECTPPVLLVVLAPPLRHAFAEVFRTARAGRQDATPVAEEETAAVSSWSSVSVVIPVGPNAELDFLARQLEALKPQLLRVDAEVIISDNAGRLSLDMLPAIPGLRIVDSSAGTGPAYARNRGAEAATGELIAFCDADDVADSCWLDEICRAATDTSLVGGRLEYAALNGTQRARWNTQTTTELPIKFGYLQFAPSCNLAIPSRLFAEVGGFDENLYHGEDVDFCWRAQRLGHELRFAPSAVMHYRLRSDRTAVWSQAINWGVSDAALLKLHRAYGARRRLRETLVDLAAIMITALQALVFRWAREKLAFRAGSLRGRIMGSVAERTWAV